MSKYDEQNLTEYGIRETHIAHGDAHVDAVGRIETRGIDFIPHAERHSSPWNVASILIGGNFAFSIIVFGWFPILFGLGWWSTVAAILIGTALGSLLLAPLAMLGSKTGTNSSVSSGAHFGVVGRTIGSLLGLFSALGFVSLTIWTGGQAVVAGGAQFFGWETTNGNLAIGYTVIAAVVLLISVYGHANMVLAQKLMIPLIGTLMIVGVFAFAPQFDASYAGGDYILGGFWPTWFLSVSIAASVPISYAAFVSDWTRYISPERWSQRSIFVGTAAGSFIGMGIAFLFGAYTASTFTDPTVPFVEGLASNAPRWYVLAVIFIGLVGSFPQGSIGLYGMGLDFSAMVTSVKRVPATFIIATACVSLVFFGTFVVDIIDMVDAFVVLLIISSTPWMVIQIIGYFHRKGVYRPADLQVFNLGQKGGAYWFKRGWSLQAVGAWVPSVVLGLLFSDTLAFTGPFAGLAGGADLSFWVAGALSAVLYLALLRVMPEPPEVFEAAEVPAENV